LVFIVFGTLSNISSSIASFVSASITAGWWCRHSGYHGSGSAVIVVDVQIASERLVLGALESGGIYSLRLVPSLKQSREQRWW
jgi:hypothetical protein